MWSLLRSVRFVPQYRRILTVLSRHGLGWLADRAGLARLRSWPRRLLRRKPVEQPLPSLGQRICQALEELGSTYILLGRYLRTRVDLLPPELGQELARLPPAGPALPPEEVWSLLEEELGSPWPAHFVAFDVVPVWHTWLDQVHQARLPNGGEVWVSVPKRSVREQFEHDRPALLELARLVDERPLAEPWWRASDLIQEFIQSTRERFDARERGRNAERWGQGDDRALPRFPEIDWERTTAEVLTFQALPGRRLSELAQTCAGQADEPARVLYRFFARAIFERGFYPLPPVLGRLVVQPDGRLAATAFTPAAYLDSALRQGVARLLACFQAEAINDIPRLLLSMGLLDRHQVSAPVQQAIRHLFERYHGLPLAEIRMGELVEDLVARAGRGMITWPKDLSLFLRTLVAVEDLGRRLSPQAALAEEIATVLQQVLQEQRSWQARQERLLRAGQDWVEALSTTPKTLRHLLTQAQEGDLLVGVEPRGWQGPMRRLKRMVHRLVWSVIAAGLLIALTLLATALFPASWSPWGWIPVGLALVTLSTLGLFLLFSFLREE